MKSEHFRSILKNYQHCLKGQRLYQPKDLEEVKAGKLLMIEQLMTLCEKRKVISAGDLEKIREKADNERKKAPDGPMQRRYLGAVVLLMRLIEEVEQV